MSTHIWLIAELAVRDLLLSPTHSPALPLAQARDWVQRSLGALPGQQSALTRLQRGIPDGERDLTFTLTGPDGLMLIALIELQQRTPPRAAADWCAEMAEALRAQGLRVGVARDA